MLYELNMLGPTIYLALFLQDAIHWLTCGNLMPWMPWEAIPCTAFLGQMVLVLFSKDWAGMLMPSRLGKWSVCQKYRVQ